MKEQQRVGLTTVQDQVHIIDKLVVKMESSTGYTREQTLLLSLNAERLMKTCNQLHEQKLEQDAHVHKVMSEGRE